MDPLLGPFALVVALLAAPAVFAAVRRHNDRQRGRLVQALRRAGEACGLTDLRRPGRGIADASDLVGESDGLLVRFEVTATTATMRVRVRIGDPRPGDAPSLTLCREDVRTSWRRGRGFSEVQIGDREFDDAIFIDGPPAVVRAVLDVTARDLVRRLLVGAEISSSHGPEWMSTTAPTFDEGELAIDVEASSARELGSVVLGVLPVLLDAARRLRAPDDVAVRLAHTARTEPVAAARLQDLLLLAREFPEHDATGKALRAALKDKDEDIRLRCALALGEEGRVTLLELASDSGTSDDGAARAIAALREHFPLVQARKVLKHALRKRRLSVAAAVLDALAIGQAPDAVPTIADVLGREDGELAVAAANALAVSGHPAAEGPLLQAIGHDEPSVRVAAARALGRLGSVAAVPSLKDAIGRGHDANFERTARQAIAEIQARVRGASPGQLSLADADAHKAGRLTLADGEAGRLSLTEADTDGTRRTH